MSDCLESLERKKERKKWFVFVKFKFFKIYNCNFRPVTADLSAYAEKAFYVVLIGKN